MTRSDLVALLAESHRQLLAKDVELVVKVILDSLSNTLAHGGRVEIRGFGSFGLNYRPPRKGRNPKTGASVQIPAKYSPHFRAGKELRERANVREPENFE
jgi:integration host factor subunit beta